MHGGGGKLRAKAELQAEGVEGKDQVVDDHVRKGSGRGTEAGDQTRSTIQEAEAGLPRTGRAKRA
jgi:hypothetical protein